MRKLYDAYSVIATPINANQVLNTLETIPDGALILAHHDDGVVWGYVAERQIWTGNLVDPTYVITPNLDTLQQVRFFWEDGEVFVWRDGDGLLQGRQLVDSPDGQAIFVAYYDEDQILWGDTAQAVADGWTRMTDGAQGLAHTVPMTVTQAQVESEEKDANGNPKKRRPLRLTIRHYLKEHYDTGALYVAVSRLVSLHVEEKKKDEVKS